MPVEALLQRGSGTDLREARAAIERSAAAPTEGLEQRWQVVGADHCVDESPRLGRVVGRAQLEDHLVLVAKVDYLGQIPFGHAPEVHMVSKLASEQVFGSQPVLDHRRRRPLRCDHGVVLQVPPDVAADMGVTPATDHRAVAIDLRQDWPAALRGAGFDPTRPTAWSAEGLLAFLPPDAQDRLPDTVTALSVTGSRFASENAPNRGQVATMMQTRMQAVTDRWREYGFDIDMTDL